MRRGLKELMPSREWYAEVLSTKTVPTLIGSISSTDEAQGADAHAEGGGGGGDAAAGGTTPVVTGASGGANKKTPKAKKKKLKHGATEA